MYMYNVHNADPAPTDAGWTPIGLDKPDGPSKEARQRLRDSVGLLLSCDHVMVLCGLGTSLEVPPTVSGRIAQFPTMGDLWRCIEAIDKVQFGKVRNAVNYAGSKDWNIEELLSRCVMGVELGTITGLDLRAFIDQAEKTISAECSKDAESTSLQHHVTLLRRLVRRPARAARAELYTTNYDRCFELAASAAGIAVVDGFSMTQPRRFDIGLLDVDLVVRSLHADEPEYLPSVIRLYKLHGSVTWGRSADASIVQTEAPASPVLIYPASSKYRTSYTQPFLEMMSRFQSGLRRRNVGVLVVGSGLNDDHLTAPLISAVGANPTLRIVIVAPDLSPTGIESLYTDPDARVARRGHPVLKQFVQFAGIEEGRVSLVNAKLSQFAPIMPALPMTDKERRAADRTAVPAGV